MSTERTDFGLRRLQHGSKITHQSPAEGHRTGSGTLEHTPSAFPILQILLNSTNRKKYTNYHLHGFTSEAYKEAPDHQCFLEQQNSCFAKEIKWAMPLLKGLQSQPIPQKVHRSLTSSSIWPSSISWTLEKWAKNLTVSVLRRKPCGQAHCEPSVSMHEAGNAHLENLVQHRSCLESLMTDSTLTTLKSTDRIWVLILIDNYGNSSTEIILFNEYRWRICLTSFKRVK